MYPPYLIDKQIKLFLNNKLSEKDTPKENSNKEIQDITSCHTSVTFLQGLRKR